MAYSAQKVQHLLHSLFFQLLGSDFCSMTDSNVDLLLNIIGNQVVLMKSSTLEPALNVTLALLSCRLRAGTKGSCLHFAC